MKIFEKYPDLKKRLEALKENRRNEILESLLESNDDYIKLRDERAATSMDLRNALDGTQVKLFEKYSDSIYAQEIFELDELYRQAISDTLEILEESGLL